MHRFYQAERSKSPSGQNAYDLEKANTLLLAIEKGIFERKQIYNNLVQSLELAKVTLKTKTESHLKSPSKSLKKELLTLKKSVEYCDLELKNSDAMNKISKLEEQYEKIKKNIETLTGNGPTVPGTP